MDNHTVPSLGPGDNCRTEKQKSIYPFGRTRAMQFVATTPLQGKILEWIVSHPRNRGKGDASRATAVWHLLEAGWHALFGATDTAAPRLGSKNRESSE